MPTASNGFWRLTKKGKAFAENAATVPEFAITLHGQVLCLAGAQRDIMHVFPGEDLTVEVKKKNVDVEHLVPNEDYGYGMTPVELEPWCGNMSGEMKI